MTALPVFFSTATLAWTIALAAPATAEPSVSSPPAAVAHVWISRSGEIFLNRQRTSLEDLRTALKGLAAQGGIVWYSRENPQEDPPRAQNRVVLKVLGAIVDSGVPVRMLTSDPDGEPAGAPH